MSIYILERFIVQVQLLSSEFNGQLQTILWVKLQSIDQQLFFTFSYKQFPLILSFVITINKSQGQLFKVIEVDLRSLVFTHGLFYIAALQVTLKAGLCVLLPLRTNYICNIVYPEILQGLAYFLLAFYLLIGALQVYFIYLLSIIVR